MFRTADPEQHHSDSAQYRMLHAHASYSWALCLLKSTSYCLFRLLQCAALRKTIKLPQQDTVVRQAAVARDCVKHEE